MSSQSPVSVHEQFAEFAIRTAFEALDSVETHDASQSQVLALGFYATILELSAGALTLVQARRYAGVPVLLRSVYEAHLDLHNLVADPDYSLNIEAADAAQQLRLMDAAQSNRLLAGVPFDPLSQADRFRQRLAELKQLGRVPLEIKERAARAGRSEVHAAAYGLMCLDAHNNASAIADRHFAEENGRHIVTFFGEPHVPSLRGRLYWLIRIVVESTSVLHAAFGSDSVVARDLRNRFEAEKGSLARTV